jgi:hypothetical protein
LPAPSVVWGETTTHIRLSLHIKVEIFTAFVEEIIIELPKLLLGLLPLNANAI